LKRASEVVESQASNEAAGLARRLGLFDATMIVMGGIIGSGIFVNPSVVAKEVHTPALILGAWAVGGLIALLGAFIYAELATTRADAGGQYAYLREAFHPAVAFIYGWTLLLVIQSGGMAAVAITFARYSLELAGAPVTDTSAKIVAAVALIVLTAINCAGVRAGSSTQNVLMLLKIAAIVMLVFCGYFFVNAPADSGVPASDSAQQTSNFGLLTSFGAAMIPVMFAYGGWQTSSFIAGELREPKKQLPRGLLLGVLGVVIIYVSVSYVCLHALGVAGLAATKTPASEVMRLALGERGAQLIAVGIAISTLGFLSQGMLTAPRVYFSMAKDGVFFKRVAYLNQARVPAVAIALQGLLALIIALSGRYEQILNYVVSADFIFFGLTAITVFVFRHRSRNASEGYRVPGHPVTTILFTIACWAVVISTIYAYPKNSSIGLAIMLTGLPVYFLWRKAKS
jgi:APA family basic amino acid/polyamine antiporter